MKKFISIVMLLAMMLSLFAGCAKEEADTTGLDKAKEFLHTSYINDSATTAMDYRMGGVVIIDKTEYHVEWTSSSDKVTFTRGEDKYVTVHVPVDNLEDVKYTLTATVSDGKGNSRTVSFERVVPARPGIPTDVADGTYVIVYDNLTFSALPEEKGYGYANATEVTVADGTVTGHTAADVITIKKVDGGFTMQDVYGRYIYLKGTYNSFNVGTELSDETMAVWQLLTGKEGKQFIINKGNMKTLAFDTSYNSWGAYPEISGTRMSTISVIAATAPEGGEPGTDEPGTDEPGTDEPGTDEPGTDEPGTEKPSSLDDQIKAAMALADQEQLPYTSTMTGKITKINDEYSEQYKNITVTIEYKGKSYKIFRVKGDKAAELKVGDTITVTGNLKKWYDDIELVNGNLDKVVAGTGSSTEKPAEKPSTAVSTPEAGVAYKFGMIQENISTTDVYYLAGGMDGYYMATTTDANAAIKVYLESTTGGYYMYTMENSAKVYINMVVSGTHVNGAYEKTASTVYSWDAENKTVVATVNDDLYWFGTRNDKSYSTVGPCKISYEGFYCMFYAA